MMGRAERLPGGRRLRYCIGQVLLEGSRRDASQALPALGGPLWDAGGFERLSILKLFRAAIVAGRCATDISTSGLRRAPQLAHHLAKLPMNQVDQMNGWQDRRTHGEVLRRIDQPLSTVTVT